jgi:hypothetical protein
MREIIMVHRTCECGRILFGINLRCKACDGFDAIMELIRIDEQEYQKSLEEEYYRVQEENSRTPQ